MRTMTDFMVPLDTFTNGKPVLLRRTATSSLWEDGDYRVYWEGLVFVNGVLSGSESIKAFVKELRRSQIDDAVRVLKGVYFLVIEDKASGDCYAFVDNSGMYQAFFTKGMISNSFLKLVKHYRYKMAEFDLDAVTEFVYFGFLFFEKTFIKAISRFPGDTIFHFSSRSNEIRPIAKKIPLINDDSGKGVEYFEDEFLGLAASLSNCKVSIDLTGGVDSRLIALLLGVYGLKMEAAVAGGAVDYEELLCSKRVADALKLPWHGTVQSIASLEEDFSELFYATDGLMSVSDYHCMSRLQRARLQRGIDTVISGAGGDFFKDVFWLQDFPLYFKHTANIERLVDTRLMTFKPLQLLLARKFVRSCEDLRCRIIRGVEQFQLESSTKTYDNICFNLLMRDMGGRELTSHSFYVKSYAPFLDLDIVRMGFNLPITMRVFNRFHRKMLTKMSPALANLRTTEGGMSASSNPLRLISDMPKFLSNRARRLLIKLKIQRQPITNYNHPEFYTSIRKLPLMKSSVEILRETGIVSERVGIEEIDNVRLGSLLTLAMLINYVEGDA